MKILGLTGGIGMGKTTAEGMLRARGIRCVDTDELAREAVAPGQPALAEILNSFGPHVAAPNGSLDRRALASVVFGDETKRKALEAILHPRIRAEWRTRVEAWRSEGRPLAVVVIPLLFETQAEKELDFTLCVACSASSQRERLLARGWSDEEIRRRSQAQLPSGVKMDRSSFVVWSEGGLAILDHQLELVLEHLVS